MTPAVLLHRNCEPSKGVGKQAHSVVKGTRWTCECGKTWRVTKRHYSQRGHDVCGCGWERIA